MPTSYQPPMRGDSGKRKRTASQAEKTNTAKGASVVRDLLAKKGSTIYSIEPGAALAEAITELRDKGIGALLVSAPDGGLAGIVSERDIVRKLADVPDALSTLTVADLMTHQVEVCALDEPLLRVLRRMTDGRYRHMPVMADDKLVGMVSIGDVVHYRLRELENETLQLKQMIVG